MTFSLSIPLIDAIARLKQGTSAHSFPKSPLLLLELACITSVTSPIYLITSKRRPYLPYELAKLYLNAMWHD